MREALYMFRCNKKLTKCKMAEKTGVSRQNYAKIESGESFGIGEFWEAFQRVFEIPDNEMFTYMKRESEK